MNALIFAAGLGTRLASITKNKPKALVEVNGKPMLHHAIQKLIGVGVTRIVINVHHHPEQIKTFVSSLKHPNVELIISDESGELLETGGGLLKAASLFIPNKPIFLYNADVITGVDLDKMLTYHQQKKGIATLMVKNRNTSRYFIFDDNNRLSGWENISTKEERITIETAYRKSLAFSGIHIINPGILSKLGKVRKFSIVEGYLELSKEYEIYGWDEWSEYWFDIGTPEKLETAESYLKKNNL